VLLCLITIPLHVAHLILTALLHHHTQAKALVSSFPSLRPLPELFPPPIVAASASPTHATSEACTPFVVSTYRPPTSMLRTASTTLLRRGRVTSLGVRPSSPLVRPASVAGLLPALCASPPSVQVSLPPPPPCCLSPYACAQLKAW
jgi:hypothetical protein